MKERRLPRIYPLFGGEQICPIRPQRGEYRKIKEEKWYKLNDNEIKIIYDSIEKNAPIYKKYSANGFIQQFLKNIRY